MVKATSTPVTVSLKLSKSGQFQLRFQSCVHRLVLCCLLLFALTFVEHNVIQVHAHTKTLSYPKLFTRSTGRGTSGRCLLRDRNFWTSPFVGRRDEFAVFARRPRDNIPIQRGNSTKIPTSVEWYRMDGRITPLGQGGITSHGAPDSHAQNCTRSRWYTLNNCY